MAAASTDIVKKDGQDEKLNDSQHQMISKTEDTSTKPEDARAALKELLRRSGSIEIKPKHRYTLKHIEVKKGKPVRHLQRLLHDQVYTKLIPATCVEVNSTTYISSEEMKLHDHEGDDFNAKNVVVRTNLVDSEHAELRNQNANCLVEDGYTKVFDGYRRDGKISRRWMRFEPPAVLPADYSDLRNVSAPEQASRRLELIKEALNKHSMPKQTVPEEDPNSPLANRQFAIWFEHEEIRLDEISNLVLESQHATKQQVVGSVIAETLRGELEQYGEETTGIILRGNRAFSQECSMLPSGLMERYGLRGEVAINSEDGKLEMSYKPCIGRFFMDNQTIASFLLSYFGHEKGVSPDDATLRTMNNLLRGTRIIIGVQNQFRKPTGVIRSLGTNAVDKPESLKALKGNVSLADLRYPKMPCVDIGDSGRPFYFPAELCQLVPNQMFRGEIPVVDRAQNYALKTAKDRTDFDLRTDKPFEKVDGRNFQMIFVNLTDATASDGIKGSNIPRPEVWAMFQREVGERFDAKLKDTVAKSSKFELGYSNVETTLVDIARVAKGTKGRKTVLVMAVPKSVPSEATSAIKAYCETVLGVQCCLVSHAELAKRYHPVTSIKMLQYTGQIVRKIFGRYNIPCQLHGDNEQKAIDKSNDNKLQNDEHGRLYGIHVVNMSDFRQTDSYKHPELDVSMYHLVTIVSVSSRRPETDVHTTNSVVKTEDDVHSGKDTLAHSVAQCLMEHARKTRKDGITKVALYCFGVNTMSTSDSDDLGNAIDKAISHLIDAKPVKAKRKPVQLTLMTPHHHLKMGTTVMPLDSAAAEDSGESAIEQHQLNGKEKNVSINVDFNLHHLTLRRIYRHSDGFREQNGSLRDTSKVWHVVKRHFESNQTFQYLERRHLPDILYLAQTASKRGQAYVYLQLDKSKGIAKEWSYQVTPVHKDLQNSLYFI